MHTTPFVPRALQAPAATQGIGAESSGPALEPDGGEREMDAMLRLLKSCVEAMGLLQARVVDLDQRLSAQPDALADVRADVAALRETVSSMPRETVGVASPRQDDSSAVAAIQADMTALREALAQTTRQAADTDVRAGRVEASLTETTKRHTDDIATARMEAAQWRMRVETDGMAFDQLSGRLATLEQGLTAKLSETQQKLVQREAENVMLQAESRVVETASDRLRMRLTTMDATIADQRARIQCLQSKLATATYAMRADQLARTMETSHAAAAFDILDLANPSGRIAAVRA